MKTKTAKTFFSLIILGLFTNCASIIHGSSQKIDISSQPAGARIFVDGKDYGLTPKTIDLKRSGRFDDEPKDKKEYSLTMELEGYMPYELKFKRDIDGWFFGNVLIGGLIGIIIDASNGAMYKLTPDQIIAQMEKSTAIEYKRADSIYLAVTLNPNPSWEKIGNLKKN